VYPKRLLRVQHSHSLYNTLTTVRKFYYKPREYLLTAEALIVLVEAVRVSIEAVRVSTEAVRCFKAVRGLEEVPESVN
jgi:hypothetical protein